MSRKPSSQAWLEFLALCSKQKTSHELDVFFSLFLTFEERSDLVTRYLIVKELLKGELTQREIAKKLKVSIAKITRGSNELKTMPLAFKKKLKEVL